MTKRLSNTVLLTTLGRRRTWLSNGTPLSNVVTTRCQGQLSELNTGKSLWNTWKRISKKPEVYGHIFYLYKDLGSSPFLVRRKTVQLISPVFNLTRLSGTAVVERYEGRLATVGSPSTVANFGVTLPNPIDFFTMEAMGTKGWNRFKPTQAQAGLGQFLGELTDYPLSPKAILSLRNSLKEAIKLSPKGASKAYLAYEFGLAPLFRDLKDVIQQILDVDKNIQQLAKDNGKRVRRSGRIDVVGGVTVTETVSPINSGGFTVPSLDTSMYLEPERRRIETKTLTEYWFSGRFVYFIGKDRFGFNPLGHDRRRQLNRILFGGDYLDLHTLYQLIPWSWLIDWVIPIGPIMDNLLHDHEDNLVADYAYVMAKSNTTTTETVTGRFHTGKYAVSTVTTTETKQRQRANPYGFGSTFTSLSLRQIAILAALGFSKTQ